MKFLYFVSILLTCAIPCVAVAEAEEVATERTWQDEFMDTWNSPNWECIIPVNTWHNRWTYDHETVHTYNERPWGFGIGKYRIDEKGNRHSLAALTFQDSHDSPEPTFAYSWQAVWREDKTIRPTLGLMGGITFRKDYHWLPIPAVLPVAGLDIGPVSIENTYIPGLGGNNGHVLFTWMVWRF